MKKNQEALRILHAYHNAVRQALIQEWDPIGVGAYAEAQDEYDSYALKLVGMLLLKKSRNEIFNYLWWLEREYMGLTGDKAATERFVDRLLQIAAEFDAE